MTARQVIRRIRDLADTAAKVHQVGSHEKWQVNNHCKITIPVHGGDIPPGTLSSIQRQGAHCLGEAWLK